MILCRTKNGVNVSDIFLGGLFMVFIAVGVPAEGAETAPESSIEKVYRITPGNIPNSGSLFVDHSKSGRTGHLGMGVKLISITRLN